MREVLRAFCQVWPTVTIGVLLALLTAMGNIALMGLSGWFLMATALAGIQNAVININLPSAGIRAAATTRLVAQYFALLVEHKATFLVLTRLRLWIFQMIAPMAPHHLSVFQSSDLMNRMISDIQALDGVYLRVISPMLVAGLSTVALTFLLYCLLPWPYAAMFMGMAFVVAVLLPWTWLRSVDVAGKQMLNSTQQMRELLVSTIQGIRPILSFGLASAKQAAVKNVQTRWHGAQYTMARVQAFSQFAMTLLLLLFICGLAALLYFSPYSTSPKLAAMVLLLALAWFQVMGVVLTATQSWHHTRGAMSRIAEIESAKTQVITFPEYSQAEPCDNTLCIKELSFTYISALEPVFEGVNLTLSPGEHIALLGESGRGKSTLAACCERFLLPTSGSITIGEADIADFSESALRSQLFVLAQAPHLFQMSIRDNLRLACEANDGRYREVLDRVELSEWLDSCKDGLDSWVGEHGETLSGGQIKRFGLAQALLRQPPVLILDEPTEGLDHDLANRIMQNALHDLKGTTVLIITHDPVLADAVDRKVEW